MKRCFTMLTICLSLLSTSACREPKADNGTPSGKERPSILLVTLDTTRADSIGPEAQDVETPAFNAIAASGRRYTNAYATVPETLPSHASMMTGLYPGGHGVHENARYIPDSTRLLAEVLQQSGYRTAAFVSAYPLGRQFGIGRGFEFFDDDLGSEPERSAEETTRRAVEWLNEHNEGPLFLWVHYFDPHHPYDPPSPFAEAYREAPYLGEIAAMDEQIGKLFAAFSEQTEGPTAVILSGDHGEGLGDHGEQQHGNLIYQSTMLIPLVIAGPDVAPGVAEQAVSSRRIFHTILDWAGIDQSQSLLRDTEGEVVVGEAMRPHLQYGWQPQIMAVEGHVKAIHSGRIESYDIQADPAETRDRSNELDLSREMRQAIREYPLPSLDRSPAVATLSDEDRRQLASLGYVSSDTKPVVRVDAPRPADMTHLFETLDQASALFVASDYQRAIPLFESILEQDPQNLMTALRLAAAYSAMGRHDQAMKAFRRAREISPESVDVEHYLALHHLRRGDWRSAGPLLERVLEKNPNRLTAIEALSEVRQQEGRPREALDLLERVLAIKGASAQELQRKGRLAMASGATQVAIDAFEELRALQGEKFQHHLELGVLYLDAKRFSNAREALERVSESDPAYPMALF
ncbi:MAG: sulfatase-like hydrolase/transferase, partial [Acidobacteria bacterium]|nr:sulfatase-like hydrolase/transferase [Acidobacteriota bacterium]